MSGYDDFTSRMRHKAQRQQRGGDPRPPPDWIAVALILNSISILALTVAVMFLLFTS